MKENKNIARILAIIFVLNLAGVIWWMLLPKKEILEIRADEIEMTENQPESEKRALVKLKDINITNLRSRNESYVMFSYYVVALLIINGLVVFNVLAIKSGYIVRIKQKDLSEPEPRPNLNQSSGQDSNAVS